MSSRVTLDPELLLKERFDHDQTIDSVHIFNSATVHDQTNQGVCLPFQLMVEWKNLVFISPSLSHLSLDFWRNMDSFNLDARQNSV